MRILAMLVLLSSLALYAFAILAKLHVFDLWHIRAISMIGIAGVNAVIATAFGVLSLEKK